MEHMSVRSAVTVFLSKCLLIVGLSCPLLFAGSQLGFGGSSVVAVLCVYGDSGSGGIRVFRHVMCAVLISENNRVADYARRIFNHVSRDGPGPSVTGRLGVVAAVAGNRAFIRASVMVFRRFIGPSPFATSGQCSVYGGEIPPHKFAVQRSLRGAFLLLYHGGNSRLMSHLSVGVLSQAS